MIRSRFLAGGETTVVTTFAAPGDALVSKRRRREAGTHDVARAAVVHRRNVGDGLTGRDVAVVAGPAVRTADRVAAMGPNQ